ncbi:acyl-CoA dehydrogenase [Salinibacterium sp. SYSU T00001]|uniref:acyl-CoA dehydrogenase n=1 Tax=Homoserinimonas sedimenticola TaxID=2986805 RepID=UPI0022363FA1|nr:acyl-CoA dehydrogenase [Salinibacterium sedimenticola]MCW4386183.1 acyl-CoA dehydrogenase [Salinibacterium sedimenticola]
MSDYRPPTQDAAFVLRHVVGYDDIAQYPEYEHADLDTVVELLEQSGEFMTEVIAPTNRAGDVEGSKLQADGTVKTPTGFKGAYDKLVESGWASLQFPEEFGGGGFPWLIGLTIQEQLLAANMGFGMCPLLTQGAIDALLHYGSPEQKQRFLPKMISGEWSGTMNLTEPHAGSDVGALTTKAVPNDDGTYSITGQKIFISWGDQDLTDNIIHLVLARTPGAPAGTKGISLFIVPKYTLNDDDSIGERNGVHTVSLEEKMGIHASPTCVLSYENAKGYLVGEENQGMRVMFVMMNSARISVGMQGLAVGERAYQAGLEYAKGRIQGRLVGATQDSPIIDYPDVRRMLMTQKAYLSALRRIIYLNGVYMDKALYAPDAAERARAEERAALLTPISKAFGTDLGNEITSLTVQIHGGMGFIEETGVSQYMRDIRIASIYEGTNGIQAADFVGRKMGTRNGASFLEFIAHMREVEGKLEAAGERFASIRAELGRQFEALEGTTGYLLKTGAASDFTSVLAASTPFLRQWSLVVGGWLMAESALAAAALDDAKQAESQFVLARFYIEQLMPAASGLVGAITAGADDLFALDAGALLNG